MMTSNLRRLAGLTSAASNWRVLHMSAIGPDGRLGVGDRLALGVEGRGRAALLGRCPDMVTLPSLAIRPNPMASGGKGRTRRR